MLLEFTASDDNFSCNHEHYTDLRTNNSVRLWKWRHRRYGVRGGVVCL